MSKVIRVEVDWNWSAIARRQVFQEFNSWPVFRPQRSDAEARTEDIVQMFLLGAVVFTFACYVETQYVTIKPQAGFQCCQLRLPYDRCPEKVAAG